MAFDSDGASSSQTWCGTCQKYLNPNLVIQAGGRCPFCGQELVDDGHATPVFAVGGVSHLGSDELMQLSAKKREGDRKIARALGNDTGKRSSLLDEVSSSLPKQRIYGGDSDVPREKPDFAPEPTDDKVLDEIREAEARKMADSMDPEDYDDDIELDQYGNPIIPGRDPVVTGPAVLDPDPEIGGTVDDPFGSPIDGVLRDIPEMDDAGSGQDGDGDIPESEPDGRAELGKPRDRYIDDDMPWERRNGIPTKREVAILSAPYPASLGKRFDRGPRPNFWKGEAPSSGVKNIDGMLFPVHKGLIWRLDAVPISYKLDMNVAKRFW